MIDILTVKIDISIHTLSFLEQFLLVFSTTKYVKNTLKNAMRWNKI